MVVTMSKKTNLNIVFKMLFVSFNEQIKGILYSVYKIFYLSKSSKEEFLPKGAVNKQFRFVSILIFMKGNIFKSGIAASRAKIKTLLICCFTQKKTSRRS